MNEQEWVVAYQAAEPWQAEIVRGLLDAQNIPAVIRSFRMQAYPGFNIENRAAAAEVLVPPESLEAAREALARMEEDGADSGTGDLPV